jgi:hypothetical protein
MNEKILARIQRCTFCNSKEINIHPPDDLGVMLCLCRACGNRWTQ